MRHLVRGTWLLACAVGLGCQSFSVEAKDWTSKSAPKDGSVFSFMGKKIGDPKSASEKCELDGVIEHCMQGMTVFGGVVANAVVLMYYNGGFSGFYVQVKEGYYRDFKEMIVGKWGVPHQISMKAYANRVGGKFSGEVLVWRTPHGRMELEQYASSLDKSGLAMLTDDSVAANTAHKKARNAEQGKKAF